MVLLDDRKKHGMSFVGPHNHSVMPSNTNSLPLEDNILV